MKTQRCPGIRFGRRMAALLLWLVVGLLTVETGYRLRQNWLIQNNPYIQRVEAGASWHNDPSVPSFPESAYCPPSRPLSEAVWQEVWRQRFSIYASLNDFDRILFGLAYGQFVFLYAPDQTLQYRFPLYTFSSDPAPADEESARRFKERFERTLNEGTVEQDTLAWAIGGKRQR